MRLHILPRDLNILRISAPDLPIVLAIPNTTKDRHHLAVSLHLPNPFRARLVTVNLPPRMHIILVSEVKTPRIIILPPIILPRRTEMQDQILLMEWETRQIGERAQSREDQILAQWGEVRRWPEKPRVVAGPPTIKVC
jgi:hypothetical protein